MIFVTGANGLVGSFIVRALLRKNIRPRCLRRNSSDLSLLSDIASEIEWIEGDLLDVPLLEQSMKGIDTIIHAAAIVSFNPRHYDLMFRTNVEGTANLVNVAMTKNIGKFFFVSSVAALGRSRKHKSIDENTNFEEGSGASAYAKTKYLSELEVWRGTEEGLKNAIVINPSIVLGPGNWYKGSTALFRYAYKEHTFFPGGNMNFVDVRDVADITVSLLESNVCNERYIINGGTLSYQQFFQKAAAEFKKKSPKLKASKFITSFAWRLAALSAFLQKKEPFLTRETAKASQNSLVYRNEKIKNLLNYEFRPTDDTIRWVTEELKKTQAV